MTHRSSGADIDAMARALAGIRESARSPFGPGAPGGVGGLFRAAGMPGLRSGGGITDNHHGGETA